MIKITEKSTSRDSSTTTSVNPDCGLKTRHLDETEKALIAMVETSRETSKEFALRTV